MLRRLLEPANLLSLVRIPLGGLALWLHAHPIALLALAALAGVSDMLDGWLARRMHPDRGAPGGEPEEPIGAWLDPLCDKAFVMGWLGAIAIEGAPLSHLALIATRDLGIAVLMAIQLAVPHLRARRRRYTARPSGKLTTVLQFAALASLLLGGSATLSLALSFAAALAGSFALAEYAARALRAEPTEAAR